MDLPEIQDWLRHKVRGEQRVLQVVGTGGVAAGAIIGLFTAAAGTVMLFLIARQVVEMGRAWWGWQTVLEPSAPLLGGLGAGLLLLLWFTRREEQADYVFYLPALNWRANESAGQVLGALAEVFLDLLYAGPRLIRFSRERLRLRRQWRRLDQERCARVLFLLHARNMRVPFAEIAERVPGFNTETDLAEMLLVRGVLHLPSDPPGLSLNSELKKLFGAVPHEWERCFAKHEPAAPEAPAPEPEAESHVYEEAPSGGPRPAKPPAFRCTGCRRKFRLRNLRGGVIFHCPLCDAEFRTVADSRGRVRVELNTDVYDPTAGIELSDDQMHAYLVLGLPPDAGIEAAKQAYRRLMKQCHPDAAADLGPQERRRMEERSKEINRAYAEILGKK